MKTRKSSLPAFPQWGLTVYSCTALPAGCFTGVSQCVNQSEWGVLRRQPVVTISYCSSTESREHPPCQCFNRTQQHKCTQRSRPPSSLLPPHRQLGDGDLKQKAVKAADEWFTGCRLAPFRASAGFIFKIHHIVASIIHPAWRPPLLRGIATVAAAAATTTAADKVAPAAPWVGGVSGSSHDCEKLTTPQHTIIFSLIFSQYIH